jgi:hypothetical protein
VYLKVIEDHFRRFVYLIELYEADGLLWQHLSVTEAIQLD